MKKSLVLIENFVRQSLTKTAHDFNHVDRVRNNILLIATKEGYKNLKLAEAAALLHDIGLPKVRKAKNHGRVGASLAKFFLIKHKIFSEAEISELYHAIKNHNTNVKLEGQLLALLRDADMLDALGNIGLIRAFTSKAHLPPFRKESPRGETWEFSNYDFDKKFEKKLGIGPTIIDQINFQISFFDNLNTRTAKIMAQPLIKRMKNFILELEKEVVKNKF